MAVAMDYNGALYGPVADCGEFHGRLHPGSPATSNQVRQGFDVPLRSSNLTKRIFKMPAHAPTPLPPVIPAPEPVGDAVSAPVA